MKSSTDVKQSTAAAPSVQGIYIDLFNNFKQPGLATSGQCDDCDCECAPQCPDCGPGPCE